MFRRDFCSKGARTVVGPPSWLRGQTHARDIHGVWVVNDCNVVDFVPPLRVLRIIYSTEYPTPTVTAGKALALALSAGF